MIAFMGGIFFILIVMGVVALMISEWDLKDWALWYVPTIILVLICAIAVAPAFV